jgi:hypothetical protein
LNRGVPFLVRVCWAARMFAATMRGRHLERSRREATIGFPVECHA